MDIKGGYYFIATVLDIEFELPVNITPTLRLERATPEQIKTISNLLVVNGGLFNTTNQHYYETEIICTKKESNGASYHYQPINEDRWKYYVISHSGTNSEVHRYLDVAVLVPPNIISFLHFFTDQEFGLGKIVGSGGDITAQSIFYTGINSHFSQKFSLEDLERTKYLFSRYSQLDRERHEGIIRAIETHYRLRHTREHDNLYVLALFMIIEMLLTHDPKGGYDSLTHQITEKVAFISPKLRQPLDYSVFSLRTKPKTLWKKLYDYRSKIAHGEHPDFDCSLKLLISHEKARDFLLLATRSILAYAIEEPDIVNGLKPI